MKFERTQQAQLIAYITKWWEDGEIPLEVHRWEEPRTSSQQALIHCIIRDIAAFTGSGEEWLKTMLKRDSEGVFPHWPTKAELNRHGDTVLVPKSESRLTKVEETALIENLYALGGSWGMSWSDNGSS